MHPTIIKHLEDNYGHPDNNYSTIQFMRDVVNYAETKPDRGWRLPEDLMLDYIGQWESEKHKMFDPNEEGYFVKK